MSVYRRLSPPLLTIFVSLFWGSLGLAQAPDFVFRLRTNDGSAGPFTGATIAPANWTYVANGSYPVGWDFSSASSWSGSATATSLSVTADAVAEDLREHGVGFGGSAAGGLGFPGFAIPVP